MTTADVAAIVFAGAADAADVVAIDAVVQARYSGQQPGSTALDQAAAMPWRARAAAMQCQP